MHPSAEAILALCGTAFIGLLFVLMINETRCLISGSDPMTDSIHDLSHRFPRLMYALAVVVGLVLGHLFWI
ncbi:MAG TPA: hypothetical protein VFH00_05240 [Candidatus Nitrosotalea sp.]|jgi:hypothetical protein|nr:hypothetical protein [Candidatus Nitrosotalea sp.]